MSGSQLTPAQIDQVRELHGVVRDWIERSAVAQKNEHLLANIPYVDLMFAFGFATLGDHATANALTEAARKVMEGPIPEGGSPQAEQVVTAAVVRNFLFKALRYRVEHALSGQALGGSLSAEVLFDREVIVTRAGAGPINNPYKLAQYVIDRFREQHRVVEPEELPDPYLDFTRHGDLLARELAEIRDVYEPTELAERTRALLRKGVPKKEPEEVRFQILRDVLPIAGRGGEPFALELVALVPEALAAYSTRAKPSPDLPFRLVDPLVKALRLAVRYRRAERVVRLADEFAELVRRQPEETRFQFFRRGARAFLDGLRAFNCLEEIDRLLTEWRDGVFGGASVEELRARFGRNRETWAAILVGLQALAGGWLWRGESARAEPILTPARSELLDPSGRRFEPVGYAELARAYVAALGNDSVERSFRSIAELFREIPPRAITNTWKTAQYYSRFHLLLVEDAVFAVCHLCRNDPVPAIVSA